MKKKRKSRSRWYALILCAALVLNTLLEPGSSFLKTGGEVALAAPAAPKVVTMEDLLPGINPAYNQAWSDIYGGSKLTAGEQLLYDQMVQAANDVMCGKYTDKDGEVYVPIFQGKGITKASAEKVVDVFLNNYPMGFWIAGYKYGKGADGEILAGFEIKESYRKYQKLKDRWDELRAELEKYLSGVEQFPDDYSKAHYLYGKLTEGKSYRGTLEHPSEDPDAHNIEWILSGMDSAVCEGFAKTYALLLSMAGVENHVAGGWEKNSGVGHAWNLVVIDGKAYLCDATWDVGTTDSSQWNWFMIGSNQDNGRHITDRTKVPKIKPGYDRVTVTDDARIQTDALTSKTVSAAPLCTMTLDAADAEKIHIYNHGLIVPVRDGKFQVQTGCVLTVGGPSDGQVLTATVDGAAYAGSFTAKEGTTVKASLSKDSVASVKTKKIEIAQDGATGTALADVTLASGKVLEDQEVTLTRDQDSVDAFLAAKSYQTYITSKEWYDEAHFDYGMLPIDTKYNAVLADLPAGITITESQKNFKLTAKQPGHKNPVTYYGATGFEIRAFNAKSGELLTQGALIGPGEAVRLAIYDVSGEAPAVFYCQTDGADKVKINGDTFTPVGNSLITAEIISGAVNITEVEPLAKSYEIANGLTAEEVVFRVLPTSTHVKTADGRRVKAKIDWTDALKNYDPKDKTAHSVSVSGKVILPEAKLTNTNNLSLTVSTKLDVAAAIPATPYVDGKWDHYLKTIIPTSVTVPEGTPLTQNGLGLPGSKVFQYSYEYNGDTRTGTMFMVLDWKYDAAKKKMIGTASQDGYDYPGTFEVDVIQTTKLSKAPTAPQYSITFWTTDGKEVKEIYPKQSKEYIGKLNIKVAEGQTDRKIRIMIPRGFQDVVIPEAAKLQNITDAKKGELSDGTVYIELTVDDALPAGNEINMDFSFKTQFSYARCNTARGSSYWAKNFDADLGVCYPAGSEIPFRLFYEANESGTVGGAYLPLSDNPIIGATKVEDTSIATSRARA